ncbi:HEAT repeat domain-containing protein [Cellvibrio sp. NN19]|uniref:HEAT repeat domain-containing protein n=1 Tax=Cellvibrio chitinivorans TaxID=3102792 RepID=UPI002B408819|nr:HEAT repeat domain-containing protein [Cellvibrio sp. NN19]
MRPSRDLIYQWLLPASFGAALVFGVQVFVDDSEHSQQQISLLENRILDLELQLQQSQADLEDARFFAAGDFASLAQGQPAKPTSSARASQDQNLPAAVDKNQASVPAAPDSDSLLRDLSTQSERDPRALSEKIADLLAQDSSRTNIAIASKSLVDLADNRALLPDYELEALYQQQRNPELQRVAAQVMAARGDNRLLEQQIANSETRLHSDQPEQRQQALIALAKTRYASAANLITPLLQDQDTGVKLDALLALRATGNQRHLHAVNALVNDPDPAVSWLARDVSSSLQNLSDSARTQLATADIVAELPVIPSQ